MLISGEQVNFYKGELILKLELDPDIKKIVDGATIQFKDFILAMRKGVTGEQAVPAMRHFQGLVVSLIKIFKPDYFKKSVD